MSNEYQHLPVQPCLSVIRPRASLIFLVVLALMSAYGFAAEPAKKPVAPQVATRISPQAPDSEYPRSEDVSTLDGIMKAYYEVVSGPAHTPRNVARDESLHHPKAQMMVPDIDENGQPMLRPMTVKAFHEWGAAVYEPGFFESEARREVLTFGRSTHVWSTYETRRTEGGAVVARGINSIQLYFDGKRYWILSETWDSERPGNPLPAAYAPQN